MTEIERNARLLCRAAWALTAKVRVGEPNWLDWQVEAGWHAYSSQAKELAAAGMTLAPIEPSEGMVDEMARAIADAERIGGETNEYRRRVARAAYRAGIGREEG